jgi:ferredoxin
MEWHAGHRDNRPMTTAPTPCDPASSAVHSLVIQPAGWTVQVRSSQTVMEAAQCAGIRLPRSCRNGTCRACMCRLTKGQVSYRIEWPGLSADEKQQGHVLPCVAYAASDLWLEAPGAIAAGS